jgi:phosphoglycolate phosphatase-like HAD superfamily hydrolase
MRYISLLIITFIFISCTPGAYQATTDFPSAENGDLSDLLPSWNRGPVLNRIFSFLDKISDPDSPDFVPTESRLAVFDLDGTLLVERPYYTEVLVAAQMLKQRAIADRNLQTREPYKSILAWNIEYLNTHGWEIVPESAAGDESIADFRKRVRNFLVSQKHPRIDRKYKDLFYTPMIELIRLLEKCDFTVYIVSASEQDFIRTFSDICLGIPDEAVIGSMVSFKLDLSNESNLQFKRQGKYWEPYNAEAGKVERIYERTGRLPIFAVGNSMGDLEMLQAVSASGLPFLNLILDHDDPVREYDYHYDTLIEKARSANWPIISIKNDFNRIFDTICPLAR